MFIKFLQLTMYSQQPVLLYKISHKNYSQLVHSGGYIFFEIDDSRKKLSI